MKRQEARRDLGETGGIFGRGCGFALGTRAVVGISRGSLPFSSGIVPPPSDSPTIRPSDWAEAPFDPRHPTHTIQLASSSDFNSDWSRFSNISRPIGTSVISHYICTILQITTPCPYRGSSPAADNRNQNMMKTRRPTTESIPQTRRGRTLDSANAQPDWPFLSLQVGPTEHGFFCACRSLSLSIQSRHVAPCSSS